MTIQQGIQRSGHSTKIRDETVETVTGWLKNRVPTGPKARPKPVELAAGLPSIIKAIRQVDLDTGEEAMTIIAALRERELAGSG